MMPEFMPQGPALIVVNTMRVLVVADTHFGAETFLARHGLHIQSNSDERLNRLLKCIDESKCDLLVLLGDVKHSIPVTTWQEINEMPRIFSKIREKVPFKVLPGNHDVGIERFLEADELLDKEGAVIDGVGYIHGHTYPSGDLLGRLIVCGHAHPVVCLYDEVGCSLRSQPAYLLCSLDADEFISKYRKNEQYGGFFGTESSGSDSDEGEGGAAALKAGKGGGSKRDAGKAKKTDKTGKSAGRKARGRAALSESYACDEDTAGDAAQNNGETNDNESNDAESDVNFAEKAANTHVLFVPAFFELAGGIDVRELKSSRLGPLSRCINTSDAEVFLSDGTYINTLGNLIDEGEEKKIPVRNGRKERKERKERNGSSGHSGRRSKRSGDRLRNRPDIEGSRRGED